MPAIPTKRGRILAGAIAGAFALAIGVYTAWVIEWPSGESAPSSDTPEAVVADQPTRPPSRETPPPLPGNDSSVAGGERYLILTGTHVAANPRESLAFIGIDPRNPQTYAANALLVNGARIASIARDHVVLERDGRRVTVDIGGAWQEAPADVRRLTRVASGNVSQQELPAPSVQPLTDGLQVSPLFDASGILTGYRLAPGRYRAVFERWGLERGDVLVAIEGMPLGDVDAAAWQLDSLAGGNRMRATIVRNGARMPVMLDGQVISDERARVKAATAGLTQTPAT